MEKLKFNKRRLITPIPDEREKLVEQNTKLRLQNQFLRDLLECNNIRIPESMDDYLETKEAGIGKEAYIIGRLDALAAGVSICNQMLIDIKMNTK